MDLPWELIYKKSKEISRSKLYSWEKSCEEPFKINSSFNMQGLQSNKRRQLLKVFWKISQSSKQTPRLSSYNSNKKNSVTIVFLIFVGNVSKELFLDIRWIKTHFRGFQFFGWQICQSQIMNLHTRILLNHIHTLEIVLKKTLGTKFSELNV